MTAPWSWWWMDFSKSEDCRIYIDRIIGRLNGAAEEVQQSLRSARVASGQGDFHAMQIHLEAARDAQRPKSDIHLNKLIEFRAAPDGGR